MSANVSTRRPREITGRTVLFSLIGFFALIAAVNAVMIKLAVSTFAGTETSSSYRASLAYNSEEAAARTQDGLHWQVNGSFARDDRGRAVLTLDARDEQHAAIQGAEITAKLSHPLNSRFDRTIELTRTGDGVFHGVTDAAPGQWTLTIEAMRGETRVYRSVSRLVLR